ncbi:hypothetical protein GW750_06060 [bacterium]|nr:hypothetical protein [bacterium]
MYIDPDAVVTQYQAAIAINRIAPKLFKVQPEMEKVLVPKSTVAEMITVAFGLKRKADYIQRMDLEDIRDKIS